MITILSAEYVGEAVPTNGRLSVGGVEVPWTAGAVGVYVRRASNDLSVIEIHLARHDGLAQEELDEQNAEADRYPLGPKEYWRNVMVGKYTMGSTGQFMTDEDFEADWDEGDE